MIEDCGREVALIAEIVNGEDYGKIADEGIGGVSGAQQHRDQRGLPIVAMNDVGRPDVFGDFDGGAGEFGVTLGVIGKVSGAVAINSVAIEIAGIVDEKITHAVEDGAVGDGRKTQAAAHGDGEAGHDDGVGFGVAVTRKDDGDFVAQGRESLGQRFDYVGEASGLGERKAFGGREEDSQDGFTGKAPRPNGVVRAGLFYAI